MGAIENKDYVKISIDKYDKLKDIEKTILSESVMIRSSYMLGELSIYTPTPNEPIDELTIELERTKDALADKIKECNEANIKVLEAELDTFNKVVKDNSIWFLIKKKIQSKLIK